jgi:hypothetical protein
MSASAQSFCRHVCAALSLTGLRSAYHASIIIADFVTDDAANGRTTHGSNSTTAG